MEKILFSRTSGRTISLMLYRLLFHLLVSIPMLMILMSAFWGEKGVWERSMEILIGVFSISVCVFTSNRMFFGFDGTAFLIMNVMGYVKIRIKFDEITSLAVVGAAVDYTAPGGNQRLGYIDENGRFVYYPYLLIYKSHVTIKREGDDARSYVGQEYGFTIIQANIQVFHAILNSTICPIYFDERIIQNNNDLYESCQMKFMKGRVKTIN